MGSGRKICRQEVFLHLATPWPRGLPKDKLAMSLVPEDIPLQQEIAATITSAVGNCLFNAVSLASVGDETQMSLLHLLVAVELILNCKFYTKHPKLTLFSSADHGWWSLRES